uniref:Receptor-type tyrosine-protein phosphatase eta n=1 Tax=Strix occidentalis caurina TaxID=311401 RepID=A0A8D0ENL0_STROC
MDVLSFTELSPVLDLEAEYVGMTSVNLTWVVNNTASSSYTYRIEVESGTSVRNLTSNVTEVEITDLIPGTMYRFTVFAVADDGRTEGEGSSISLYTEPSPVLDLQAEYVGMTSVNLTWVVNNTASSSYTYRIEVESGTSVRNLTSNVTKVEITDLIPGTMYRFTVFAIVADGQMEGEGSSINLYTSKEVLSLSFNMNARQSLLKEKRTEMSVSLCVRVLPVKLLFHQLGCSRLCRDPAIVVFAFTEPSPVLDLKAEYVGVTSVTLTWVVNNTASSSYTYRIEVVNGTSIRNLTSSVTKSEITELIPGMMYNFTVFSVAADGQTEGEGMDVLSFTEPSPVLDLQAEYIGVTSVNLTWVVNNTASSSYTYRIEVESGTSVRNLTSNVTKIEITELIPGTMYRFTVFAVADDGRTEGEGSSISLYTEPSSVLDLQAEYVGMTSVNLTWVVNNTASSSYTYRIEVESGTSVRNLTSNVTEVEITDLIPGTMYRFTVFAVADDGRTEGEGSSISLYTSKSRLLARLFLVVCILLCSTGFCLSAQGTDDTYNYTCRLEIQSHGSSSRNQTSSVTRAVNTDINPGAFCIFIVFVEVSDSGILKFYKHLYAELTNRQLFLFTIILDFLLLFFYFISVPALVNSFQCEPVAKQSSLMLKWECPSGNNSGFKIKIFNDTWEKEERTPSCMREGSEEVFRTASLDYFNTYTVTIATLSNSSESPPVQKICNTSITDPPAPSKAPLVKAVSHSSLSVEFSDFESVNGPLKAYAVMITTEEQGCASLKSKLNNTYKDFKKTKTVTYVTYVIKTEQAKPPSFHSQNGTNIVNVGKGNTMYGYENGPLIPLRSYRASVAGFTNITFTVANIIVGEDSYVSFSPCSEAVLLPQDPGVIAGAVIGCLLAILAVVAIGGFIFWRRRRSKMIKVENFESYFKKQQADSNCGFAEEYEELKSAGVHQPKFAAELAENRGKNRYNNVLPYDISRVKLSDQSSATDDYINANYMPGYNSKKAFIAAQGPLPNTIEDFWRMIWEKNIYSIVMLTKCVEQARTKCEQYWPDKQSKSYGDIIVTMVSEAVLPEWTVRDFTVEKSNTPESHSVRQFHFTSWPDHGVPETTDLLINFRHLVHEYSSQNPIDSPTLVHCSAGVGRTGTFIAIDRLIQQVEMENTVDVYGVVYDLRMHRPLMVQTEDQYVFLNQCVMDIIRSQKDKKTDLIYQNMTAMAIYENFTPGPGFGKANGYHA